MAEITNTDAIKAWSRASQEIVAAFGDEGDFTRSKVFLNNQANPLAVIL